MDKQERVYIDREDRTFETRLQFIEAIFSNRYKEYSSSTKSMSEYTYTSVQALF